MSYYTEVVEPLQWAVLDIQRAGMLVDLELAKHYHAECDRKQLLLKEWFKNALGYTFNPNSKDQVLALFNEDFRIPLRDSSDELSLLKTQIRFPEVEKVVGAILDYRNLGKMRSTYLQPEPWFDGRVRSQFRVYGTLTWRLSSREPNLQNLPRDPSNGINIRSLYRAPSGSVLVEFDKMQLEARIPAYASRCQKQIERFESGVDLYCAIAEACGAGKVTKADKEVRYNFKQFKLADGYGASANRVSDTMLLNTRKWYEPSLVKKWQEGMKADTPEIYSWFNQCWDYAIKNRRLEEGFGVPRLLYGRKDDLRQVAYSWPTQATASGILNRALVRVHKWLKKENLLKEVKVVCQIHDALMFEIPLKRLSICPQLKSLIDQPETIFGTQVLLPSDAKMGERWGEMKPIEV